MPRSSLSSGFCQVTVSSLFGLKGHIDPYSKVQRGVTSSTSSGAADSWIGSCDAALAGDEACGAGEGDFVGDAARGDTDFALSSIATLGTMYRRTQGYGRKLRVVPQVSAVWSMAWFLCVFIDKSLGKRRRKKRGSVVGSRHLEARDRKQKGR